jgi:hypothetical protein
VAEEMGSDAHEFILTPKGCSLKRSGKAKMSIRFIIKGLLVVAMTTAVTSAAFGEECRDVPEKLGRPSGSGFCVVRRDLVAWGVLGGGALREMRHRTGILASTSSLKGDDMLPVGYEIAAHSYGEWTHDRTIYSESSARDEVGILDSTIVFGLKYSFKTFQLGQFRKSILSFMGNGNGTGTARERAMEFYVEIP